MSGYIEVSQEHLAEIIAENVRLRARVDELLEHGNRLLLQVRGVPYQAREFRAKMGFLSPPSPAVPDDDQRRLVCSLVVEECVEFLSAAIPEGAPFFGAARSICATYIARGELGDPQLTAVARELADVDYVVEGARQTFGIDGGPIAVAVHLANMSKDPSARDESGKVVKSPGFVAPDEAIALALIAQGARDW